MNSLPHEIQALTKIYPEHIWINVNFDSLDKCLTQAEIDLMSIAAVKEYLIVRSEKRREVSIWKERSGVVCYCSEEGY